MHSRLSSLFGGGDSTRPVEQLRRFTPTDSVLSQDAVTPADDGWLVENPADGPVRLFEVPVDGMDKCMLTYRANMRSEDLDGRAFLEMWVRIPGKGEFFSRGLHQPLKGTTEWVTCEIPFRLKKGQKTDLVKLNLVVEGWGRVWIKNVELLKTPL